MFIPTREMIARTYGHMDIDWVRKIQDRMNGKKPGIDEVQERPDVPYDQESPKAYSFWLPLNNLASYTG